MCPLLQLLWNRKNGASCEVFSALAVTVHTSLKSARDLPRPHSAGTRRLFKELAGKKGPFKRRRRLYEQPEIWTSVEFKSVRAALPTPGERLQIGALSPQFYFTFLCLTMQKVCFDSLIGTRGYWNFCMRYVTSFECPKGSVSWNGKGVTLHVLERLG